MFVDVMPLYWIDRVFAANCDMSKVVDYNYIKCRRCCRCHHGNHDVIANHAIDDATSLGAHTLDLVYYHLIGLKCACGEISVHLHRYASLS